MSEIVASKPVNDATDKEVRTRSSFVLDYDFYQGMRYAEYTPHFVQEGVDSDNLPLRCAHRLLSYTLQAPLLSGIKMNKDYFFVPMECILPLNWPKWYKNPVIGQDCPNDCGPSVDGFWNKIATLFVNSWNDITNQYGATPAPSGSELLSNIFKLMVFFERFYSDGSLMANLGIHGNQFYKIVDTGDWVSGRIGDDYSYDEWFDILFGKLTSLCKYFTIQYGTDFTNYYVVEVSGRPSVYSRNNRIIGVRDYLELLRDDFTWNVISATDSNNQNVNLSAVSGVWSDMVSKIYFSPTVDANSVAVPCDLRRMWAYQLVCFHYFTNDKVDFIFSAELFRQYIREITSRNLGSGEAVSASSFIVNGLQYEYDALSGYVFDRVVAGFTSRGIFGYTTNVGTGTLGRPDNLIEAYAYFRALLGFNRSLRFKDYFTGSRTRPLAVENPLFNTDVQVNNNLVSVINVTRGIQAQRFLNAINRLPAQIEDYLQGLFGKRPAPDYHNPFFLARTTDSILNDESEYTGNVTDAEANNTTTVLRSNAEKYCFEFSPDRDCVVIGITSFDLVRAYGRTIERQALHLTRYDGFNTYMQFLGDQVVNRAELGVDAPNFLSPFGYQLRHMEYKQRYNQVAGPFRRFLPGYVFLADEGNLRRVGPMIDPDYIRNWNTELDRFYKSETGYSLGSYFHFLIKNQNMETASRPMAYAPSIL